MNHRRSNIWRELAAVILTIAAAAALAVASSPEVRDPCLNPDHRAEECS